MVAQFSRARGPVSAPPFFKFKVFTFSIGRVDNGIHRAIPARVIVQIATRWQISRWVVEACHWIVGVIILVNFEVNAHPGEFAVQLGWGNQAVRSRRALGKVWVGSSCQRDVPHVPSR